ncbi:NfeD family protein [Selenihalanaerobacter shriftii]|uniref:Membrane-bound serine protease (ClpP class) n=1 Tax=Selenihalanaerobacter shriftii TaxID=142842 RepID=A0A1T4PY18_9FIRM|nr:NfeD family protein [Selenihalanaerobacter shriftii]SJZ96389.1 membrane-bound serine protease (ClpP class) [Selenihalanaerobacter shriftii]
MYRRCLLILLLVLGLLIGGVGHRALANNNNKLVYQIPVKGTIDLGLAKFISRGIQQAEEENADAILLSIDTFGGLVKASTEIRDTILKTDVPVIAYVENRAWSAGALITTASDQIYMNSGSSIGAAETRPKEEKFISAFRKEFESTAEKTGRDPKLAAAMVDARVQIDGVVEQGQILTLTAKEAEKLTFINGVVNNREEALIQGGYHQAEVRIINSNLKENLARFTSNPLVSTILLTIGFIGLILEGITLGWGASGSVGLLSLGLYFAGRLIAGTTGFGLILFFILGIFLLALEVLVVPGFGITGIGGIIAVLSSLFFSFENKDVAIYVITISTMSSIVGILIALKYFITSTTWSRIELSTAQTKEDGYISNRDNQGLVGKQGITITPLRPAGVAQIGDQRKDVVSEGGFISKEQRVEVIAARGRRIVVRQLTE